ncbi:hypothetical protein [Aerococcus viridans]|uniref:hypothetical protein n=1 Tax=Aerococcus viridans TaxID=1377 RepID=UPI0002EF253C|nr:hypothetical protein [Aerococcus viridans]
MKKHWKLFGLLGIGLFVLMGCGQKVDLAEHAEIVFDGMDTNGYATYDVITDELLTTMFDYNPALQLEQQFDSDEMQEFHTALYELDSGVSMAIDKYDNLSNGDEVTLTVTVDEGLTDKYKSGTKTVTVSGLEEPEVLTSKDVQSKLIVNFNGYSGRGYAQIDNLLDDSLSSVNFSIAEDGKLSNGKTAKIEITPEFEESVFNAGYKLEDNFDVGFEVKGLNEIASSPDGIANIDDVVRMIDEALIRNLKNNMSFMVNYSEYEPEATMYRQFDEENGDFEDYGYDEGYGYNEEGQGVLLKIYTIKDFYDDELRETYTYALGYSDLTLDENKNVNVSTISDYEERWDDTYSLESVIKMYEAKGYSQVEL